MTTKNNFDKSSTGTDIECVCFYDTHLSQSLFDENFKILQHEGYRTFTKAYYIENGNVPDDDEITFKLKGTLEQKTEFLKKEGYTDDDMPPPENIDETIIDTYGEKISLLNYQDFSKQYEPLSLEPSKRIEWIVVRGCSQGDYAEVAYCPDDLEKAWGNAPEENSLKKTIDHLFWDAPIYACFKINDDEFCYHDQPEYDEYEWDREKFLKFVAEKSGVAIENLEPLLPDHPSC